MEFSEMERARLIRKDSHGNSVYAAVHRSNGMLRALKVISYNQDDARRRRILQEMQIFRGLDHPNVVKCYGVSDQAGEICVLLEYMSGGSLEGNHIEDEPSLADLAGQILSALSYLHSRRIAHKDVKPSNLLIDCRKRVKLADFGSSRISVSTNSATVAYLSPERIDTNLSMGVYDGYAGDIWGFGLSILELYLGNYPIRVDPTEEDLATFVSAICKESPPEAPPTATTEFRDFIACCLQRDPAKRWTAKQLLGHPFIVSNTSSSWKAPASALGMDVGDKMPLEHLKEEIESVSGPFPGLEQSAKRRSCGTTIHTTIHTVSATEFRQKVMELTGLRAIKRPRRSVDVVAETDSKPEADTATVKHIVEQLTLGSSLPSVTVPNEVEWNTARHLKSCILYCSLFPPGFKFEKDRLVQLWVAEGLIKAEENERMEDVGSLYFDYMLKWEYIVLSGIDYFGNQEIYKVGEAMASILERESLPPFYFRVKDCELDDTSMLATHMSLVGDYIDQMTLEALKKRKKLRTLLCLGNNYGSSARQLPRGLFVCLESVNVLDLSCMNLSEIPNSVGNLKSLLYLDVSKTHLKRLPESVDCLDNLQTLRLRGCLDLVGLPKYISKLVNLRHLDLDIARQLKSMPLGMGNLTSLQTLSTFLVGNENGCRIGELRNMNNLSGSLCIARLENVLDREEAKLAALSSKQYLNKLELRWGDLRDKKADNEDEILECLQPHVGLKELQILFYQGSLLPDWISSPSFATMSSITLYKCKNCYLLPSIGELPSLKSLTLVEMNGVRDINHVFCRGQASQGHPAFPKLEELTFDVMQNLEEWTGVENGDFPCLLHLQIRYCPKLFSLPCLSHLASVKYLEIGHCPELSSFPEEGLPASLGFLMLRDCATLKERCQKDEGEDWFKIAHVPSLWIDHEEISKN